MADKPAEKPAAKVAEELDVEQYGRQLVKETEEYLGKWARFSAWLTANGRT